MRLGQRAERARWIQEVLVRLTLALAGALAVCLFPLSPMSGAKNYHATRHLEQGSAQAAQIIRTRYAIRVLRNRVWYLQDRRHARRAETGYLERNVHKVARLQRLKVYWWRLARRNERLTDAYRAAQTASVRYASTPAAICTAFGAYCSQAIAVARCESGLSTSAANGQYLGLFQMGDYARARYGSASDALGQARAAFAYFRDSGYSWAPWECKP